MAGFICRLRLAPRKLRDCAVVVAVAAGGLGACAPVAPIARLSETMPVGAPTAQPIGAMLFCATHRDECGADVQPAAPLEMTEALRRELHEVQLAVDRRLDPHGAVDVAWHYSVDGKATCVQYAMEKRRELITLGLPSAALHLATAITDRGEGHLVLVVATTQGDLVLDNLRYDVAPWQVLPYRWIARAQGGSLAKWVSINAAS